MAKAIDNNDDGNLGEILFNVAISRHHLFRTRDLGEKWPVSDFYVELKSNNKIFFIVQVKSSRQGYSSSGKLKITAPKEKLNKLRKYYAPTYLAGVDLKKEQVYLIPINKKVKTNISRLPTSFEIERYNAKNSKILFDDVKSFWKNSGILDYKRKFKHNF